MTVNFEFDKCNGLVYYGNSDFLAQIVDHIQRHPESCLTKNLKSFYNSLYSELSDSMSCAYQVEINEDLCTASDISNEGEAIDALLDFIEGSPRRTANRAIRRISRKVIRENTRRLSEEVDQ